jgi:hypothetical protein
VADQYEVMEAGGHDRRRPIGLLVVLVLLAASVVGVIATRRSDPPVEAAREPPAAPIRSLTRFDSAPNLLYPRAREKGGVARIGVIFPDGTRATVRYPAELRLDRLGVRPFQGLWVDGAFRQLTAPYYGELEITKGGEPIRSFGENVTLWPRQAGAGSFGQVLLFAFGPWRMAVYDRERALDFTQRVELAEGLRGRAEDGYLVLSSESGRIRLAEPGDVVRGEPVGPQLWFGGGATHMVALVLAPDCRETRGTPRALRGRGHPIREVCRNGVRVIAMGDDEFIGKALDGIRISVK